MSYVYILSNEYMPGVYKVGFTQNCPISRAHELYSGATGVPAKFRVEAFYQVFDPQDVETYVHHKLEQFRINDGREFFKVDPALIEQSVLGFIAEHDQVIGKNSSYLDQSSGGSRGSHDLTPSEMELLNFNRQQQQRRSAEDEKLELEARDLRARLELERLRDEERYREQQRAIELSIGAEYMRLLKMAREYKGRTEESWSGSYYATAYRDVQEKIASLLSQYPWLNK